ncbi:unnamed protein product [Linum tenue]|uniref:RING-type E3 ubiquitin transferase n=1 Tax=Linum tenue TaxID=586396 RepID=A0AAV0RQL4_9ROSI|nr:unnamed protein product [Linum tenue]
MAACDLPIMSIAGPSPASKVMDDSYEESCSICLEPFTVQDPATVTNCKHEYHLQCILDWCQRSKECPICWQLLSLKEQSSQELLAAVAAERHSRLTIRSRPASATRPYLFDNFDVEQDSYSDDSDFDERIGQHLAAAVYRARQFQRRENRSPPRLGTSRVFVFEPHAVDFRNDQQISSGGLSLSPASSGSASPTSPIPSLTHLRNSEDAISYDRPNGLFRTGILFGQSQSESPDEPGSSRIVSLSDSIKSKWVAASSKYKESITKGTQGIKEKLLARNNSVKELSKGVQREMSAGIAGVARMVERLELSSSKRSSPAGSGETGSSFCFKGKNVEDNSLARALQKDEAMEEISLGGHRPSTPVPCHSKVSHLQVCRNTWS